MIARRDLLIGTASLLSAGAAQGLKPRRRVSLLGVGKLEGIIPTTVGDWVSRDVADQVAPKEDNSLASRLYSQTVGRVYQQPATGTEVMMLLAYGNSQTNDLQLHRPEICYPAYGYELSGDQPVEIRLPGDATIPARRLTADVPGRRENIVYWARLGEFLPQDRQEQRDARLKTAFAGEVADGVLARFSALGEDPASAFAAVLAFVPMLVTAIPADRRSVLVGAGRARAMLMARA